MPDAVTPCADSLFQQPWWLDALAPGAWDAVEIQEGGATVARLPFVRRHRLGVTVLTQPALTPHLGPWLRPLAGKECTRLAREHELLGCLVDRLPAHDVFHQNFHRSLQNWLPFCWKGFKQTTYYTYVLDDVSDPRAIWADFRENVRRQIRKAERTLTVSASDDVGYFLHLNRKTFERQGMDLPYPPALIGRLDEACAARGARRILVAEDEARRPHAALYLVWDDRSAYYLMGGADPALRTSGAMSLLMWEAIKHAGTVTRAFDFEGSMVEPIERFFRAFGPRQAAYLHVFGARSLRGRVAGLGRDMFRDAARRLMRHG
jgi:hypothetical protein